MNPITPPREFIARRLADERCRKAGADAQRSGASRMAARLYRAGSSVDAAVREACRQVQAVSP